MFNFQKELSDKINDKRRAAAENQVYKMHEAIKADIAMRRQVIENWDGIGFCPVLNPLCYKYEVCSGRLTVRYFATEEANELYKTESVDSSFMEAALEKAGWVKWTDDGKLCWRMD